LAEHGLSRLADDSFSPTYPRNATAYGFSPRLRLDIVVNKLTAVAMTNRSAIPESRPSTISTVRMGGASESQMPFEW